MPDPSCAQSTNTAIAQTRASAFFRDTGADASEFLSAGPSLAGASGGFISARGLSCNAFLAKHRCCHLAVRIVVLVSRLPYSGCQGRLQNLLAGLAIPELHEDRLDGFPQLHGHRALYRPRQEEQRLRHGE